MHDLTRKYWWIILIFIGLFTAIEVFSLSQPYSQQQSGFLGTATAHYQDLGTGLEGTITDIFAYFSTGGGLGGTKPNIYLQRCDDAGYSVNCTWELQYQHPDLVAPNTDKQVYWTGEIDITLDVSKYYRLYLGCWANCYNGAGTNAPLYSYGSIYDDYEGGDAGGLRLNGIRDFSFFITIPEVFPDITATDPPSLTIITNPYEELTFEWTDISDYDYMIVGFNHRGTGVSSDYVSYNIDSLTGSSTTIILDAFGIDKNGDWYFQGFLTILTPQIFDEFISGQYISETTDDLAEDDDYYLRFSVLGWESMFVMETFEDWYSTHSTRYDSPTDMFVAITGFFEPTFNKIGEFGQRIHDYFDLDEAYSSGYDIGKNIPIFAYYISQISVFIGNFPFIKWVFIALLFFIGVFIFRLIMKFIPFFSN